MREENGRGTAGEQEVDGVRHRPRVNQRRHEPVSGSSHHAGQDPAASEERRSAAMPPGAAAGEPGKAVRDMMGGPQPQGDVPDAPATQIAATDDEGRTGTRVSHVANAVPGKPDGEVDTRGGYTGS
ncbi:MAG TPA: hypothetical protein VKS82_24350 [Streptosporangiaceae bacterium]|nr:hypothetical protein [Streptosporangiaceae bacterium]